MFTTRPELLGTFGATASTHWLSATTGMGVLERGGNAFDAAATMGFVQQVVEPQRNGPGGEVPILFHQVGKDGVRAISGQGVAPAAATVERYRGLGLDLIPGTGFLAATIPGPFDAWMVLIRDRGTLPLRAILEPAIALAEKGYPITPRIAVAIAKVADVFRTDWPTSAALYLPNGEPPKAGTYFRNPALARAWKRLIEEGEAAGSDRVRQIEAARRAWSQGFVAEAIERFVRTPVKDTSGRAHAGLITADDLARWQAKEEAPITYDYGRYTVAKCGTWSQGPVFLQQLALLKGKDLAKLDPNGAEFVHLCIEATKLAFADRNAYYGDPDFVDVPMGALLSDAYNAERRKRITDKAAMDTPPGVVPGYQPNVAKLKHSPEIALEPHWKAAMPADTVHLDVIDRHGNMVSATPSGGWLPSSPVIPELGFPLGTRGQIFSLDPKHPNALAPGKRPRTTLTPSLALRDGKPYMAFGTPGGDQQDQWSLVMFLRHVHHGMNLQEAIDAPAFHTSHFESSFWPRGAEPGKVQIESRFGDAVAQDLRRRGHDVEIVDGWSEGNLSAISREGEHLKAGANPRYMEGYAVCR
ncbi:MAG: gamma-glutamyltransferase family protein [Alphaproteobacteria bacterium]|nr:gamma-glutamyltransferase family protein [Alphaproteobacteria bacterium]